ncbi:MAG: glycosyltransferase [Hyphomicrobiaceae bacterium]|nr:glycosyltransferase [Hyphomicrobiaceae bacterium]
MSVAGDLGGAKSARMPAARRGAPPFGGLESTDSHRGVPGADGAPMVRVARHAGADRASKSIDHDNAGLRHAEATFAAAGRSHLLMRLRPDLSAGVPVWAWQKVVLLASMCCLIAAMVLLPGQLAAGATAVLAPVFASVFLMRFLAIASLFFLRSGPDEGAAGERLGDEACPSYAVLVPLYDEAAIVPALVAALRAIDYPASRLFIRLIVEEHDKKTRAALDLAKLPPHMKVVVAPDGLPRTKPRALNIALAQTPGQFVVVYDAEDLPERDQLRRAVAAFQRSPKDVVCLQACLNTFNPAESWLARQFTIEYSALFDILLPALERFGLPVPLGGTSNHFRGIA